ncbi:toxin-antitoxin system YwqK family antitoxin [Pseudooceanicola sp.]|uniref:toxin-antitoxin system YwqK family antitoxin n=1 Tax=Pseudooceanicola sp. TaxID=1914328 RepID=UPI0035C6739F
MATPVKKFHKSGTLHATGQEEDDLPVGYWEWFREDGTKKRSGQFERGEPRGEWITYDAAGRVHKVTQR